MIQVNWEALEADFQATYGIDLKEAVWGPGRIGLRKLRGLIRQLPDTARFYRTIHGGVWGIEHELMAQQIELLYLNAQIAVAAASKKRRKIKAIEFPRPERVIDTHIRQIRRREATLEDLGSLAASLGLGGNL